MRIRSSTIESLIAEKSVEIIARGGLERFTISKLAVACKISVGTCYIYFKDKDDLIAKVVGIQARNMETAFVKNFSPTLSLEAGLRIQWHNRFDYLIKNPLHVQFFDQISNSSYSRAFMDMFTSGSDDFLMELKDKMSDFVLNAVNQDEMDELPFELFWSLAFGPLYTMIRLHQQDHGLSGTKFNITEDILNNAFSRMIRAVKR